MSRERWATVANMVFITPNKPPIDIINATIIAIPRNWTFVAEAVPVLTKKLGAAETKEIVAELRSVEAGIDALDTRAESVGGTAPALDAAAAPLVARIDAVKQLVELTR